MTALVVDDDFTIRMVLQELLAPYAEVHSCVNGLEAVQAVHRALEHRRPYDLILLDIDMPSMGGLQALKHIREEEERHGIIRPGGSKIIMATAAGDGESKNAAFRELCDAYVVKPIDGSELLNLIYCLFPIEEHTRSR